MSTPGPRLYVRKIPSTWWLARPAYTQFMLRELSSAFIAAYALFVLFVTCSSDSIARFHAVYQALRSPLSVFLHLVVLGFALFHTVTFFNLTPRAIVLRFGEEKVGEDVIKAIHYAAWAVASVALLTLALLR